MNLSQVVSYPLCLFAAFTFLSAGSGCSKQATEAVAPAPTTTRIATELAARGERPTTLQLAGTLRGSRQTSLAANTSGRIVETCVERGARVAKGQVLARTDGKTAGISRHEAIANRRFAQLEAQRADRDCKRYEALGQKGDISKQEYERITAQCETAREQMAAAEARADQAEQNLADGAIRAPYAGLVSERFVEVGQYVQPSTAVAALADTDELRLVFTLPERFVSSLKVDDSVNFYVSAAPGAHTATLRYISHVIREATRDAVVEAKYDNKDQALWPGMFATVAFPTGRREVAILPKRCAVEIDNRLFVYVVVGDRVEQRVINSLDAATDPNASLIATSQGVQPGERLACDVPTSLRNGAKVEF